MVEENCPVPGGQEAERAREEVGIRYTFQVNPRGSLSAGKPLSAHFAMNSLIDKTVDGVGHPYDPIIIQ